MKRLIIVRHAQAIPRDYDFDFQRDLTPKGESDAAKISSHLQNMGIAPQHMMSSPAKRALKTATIFAENLGYPPEKIEPVEKLYMDCPPSHFLALIRNLPDDFETVFAFGHNPEIAYCADYLFSPFNLRMPTCSTVGIDFDTESWQNIEPDSGKLLFQFIPEMF